MKVTIKFPDCIGKDPDEKRNYLLEIGEWGDENLPECHQWKYIKTLFKQFRLNYKTSTISFDMDDEAAAMALKLMWCE